MLRLLGVDFGTRSGGVLTALRARKAARRRGNQKGLGENCMTSRPLDDRVLLRRLTAEEEAAGGIIIPGTAKEKPQEGEVIAVGPGILNDKGEFRAFDLKAGDRILFGKWSGTEVKLSGEELLIIKESDIMGVVEDAAAAKRAA
jgi:chaperonin GroES